MLNQYQAGIASFLNVVTALATALPAEAALLLHLQNRRLAAAAMLFKNIAGRRVTDLSTRQPACSASTP